MLKNPDLPLKTVFFLKSLLLIFICFLGTISSVQAQKLESLTERDTMTYVFKLDNEQLKYIFENDEIKDSIWFFKNKIDSFSFRKFDQSKLPNGCYLKTEVVGHQVRVMFIANYPFELKSKTIKGESIFYLLDAKNKKEIITASMQMNERNCLYDAGYGGYVLNVSKDKKKNKYIRVLYKGEDYYFHVKSKGNYIPKPSNPRGVNSSISPGYFIASQPKYRHLDTVKYKAYFINPFNGKPIRKKIRISFSDHQKTYWTKKIKRKSLGAYFGQFTLSDTLKIDKEYKLLASYSVRGRRFYNTETFRLEDYKLDKSNYNVIVPQDTFHAGEDVNLYAKATDANGFALSDTKLSMKMSIEKVFRIYQDTIIFKKDERNDWYKIDTIMDEFDATKINIPMHRLLNAFVKYKVEIEMTDVQNERKKFTKYFYYDAKEERTIFIQHGDTIVARELFLLKDTAKVYDLFIYQNGMQLDSLRIRTPFKKQIEYNYTQAILREPNTFNKQSVYLTQNLLSLINLKSKRTHDSINIELSYPMRIPLHYKIYKEDQEVASGAGSSINFKRKDASNDDYYLLITSNLNGQINDNYHFFKLSQDSKLLDITTNLPKEIYPGASVPLEILVKDYKGQPKENINITSYAISSMFKEAIRNPQINKPNPNIAQLEKIKIEKSKIEHDAMKLGLNESFRIQHWMISTFNLYKNDYYKIFYPVQNTYTHYLQFDDIKNKRSASLNDKTPKQKIETQFAVVPILGHRIVRPLYVTANKQLIYHDNADVNLPYSSALEAGKYNIEVRFQDKLLQFPNVTIRPSEKTLLVVNLDSILDNNNREYIISDSLPSYSMTKKEFAQLDKKSLFVSGLYFDTLTVYPLNDEANVRYYFRTSDLGNITLGDEQFRVISLPPHKSSEEKFVLNYGKKSEIISNKDFQFNFFYEGKVVSKTYDSASAPLFSRLRSDVSTAQLLNKVNSVVKAIEKNAAYSKAAQEYFEPGKKLNPPYNSPVGNFRPLKRNTQSIEFDIAKTDSQHIVAIWIINIENPSQSTYSNMNSRQHQILQHQGGSGHYDIYFLFDNKTMRIFKNHLLNERDYWYVNTNFFVNDKINEESLTEPILLYNQLTKIPMQPFLDYPDESDLLVKMVKNTNRSAAVIKGILRNENGQILQNTNVYLEQYGQFYRGATTNNKGEFEFLNVAKGKYMMKVFADRFQARYAYNININQNAEYTYTIELHGKEYLQPSLQINENEVQLLIFQSQEENKKASTGYVFDIETRAPLSNVTITYLDKKDKILATTISNSLGKFDIYEPQFVDSAFNIKIEHKNYRDLILKYVEFTESNTNLLNVFLRTKTNSKNLPIVIDMGLEEKAIVTKDNPQKTSAYSNVINTKTTFEPSSSGGMQGRIVNNRGESVPFASIGAFQGGVLRGQAKSNLEGYYKIKPLGPGTYTIKVSSVGYNKIEIQGITVRTKQISIKNIIMAKKSNVTKSVVIKAKKRLVNMDSPGRQSVSREEISKIASVNIVDATSTIGGINNAYNYAPTNISGDRDDATLYLVDGMTTRGNAVGLANIEFKESNISQKGKKFDLYTAAKAKSIRTLFSNLGYWEPNLITNKDGRVFATVQFPDDVTLWKNFIVAMGRDYFYKVHTTEIKSYKPIMVNSIVPRFFHLSDKMNARAKYVNFDRDNHNMQIKISINDTVKLNRQINLEKQHIDSVSITAHNIDSIKWKAELDMDSYYKDGEEIMIPVFRDGLETKAYELFNLDKDSMQVINLGEKSKTTIYFNNTILENILVEINKLKQYPYGCNEQKASKIKGLLMEEKIRASLNQKFEHKRLIKKMINELERSQKPDGSWSWWSNGASNARMTIYLAEVLYDAIGQNYNNSSSLLAKEYIRKRIRSFNQSDRLYALYLLRKMNSNVDYNSLTKDIDYYSLNTCDKLYYISNQFKYKNKISKSQVYDCLSQLNAEGQRSYSDNFFYDPSANMALAIKLLKETAMKDNAVQSVGSIISSGRFISNANTFSKVYLIEAWLESMAESKKDVTANLVINDSLKISKFPFVYTTTDSKINVQHSGAPVWTSVVQDIYLADPVKKDSLFDVRTRFMNGRNPIEKLIAGQDAALEVKVMSFKSVKNVMLEVPIPAPCTYQSKMIPRGNISHIEYYKNKVIYYLENLSPGQFTLSIPLRVNFSGDFSLPPANISLMYYPFKSGNNTKRRISVN